MEQEKKKGRIASASILTWTFIKKKKVQEKERTRCLNSGKSPLL